MSPSVQLCAFCFFLVVLLGILRCDVAAEILTTADEELEDRQVNPLTDVIKWIRERFQALFGRDKFLGTFKIDETFQWNTWKKKATDASMMDNQGKFIKHPVVFQMQKAFTPGDVRPYLLVAFELYKKNVPVVVLAQTQPGKKDMARKASFAALENLAGAPTLQGDLSDRAEVYVWIEPLGQTKDQPKFLLLIMDIEGQESCKSLLKNFSKDLSVGIRSVYVTNALHDHDHENCMHAACGSKVDQYDMGHRQHHIEASIIQGVTYKLPGEVVFNARSATLFPPCSSRTYKPAPNPLGVISNTHTPDQLPVELQTWFNGNSNTLCVTFSSFLDRMEKYAAVFKELSRLNSETHIFLQVKANFSPEILGEEFAQKLHASWHYMHRGNVAYLALFPRCGSVVHLGGAATASEVLWAGKPQAILYENTGPDKESITQQISDPVTYVRQCSGHLTADAQNGKVDCNDLLNWASILKSSRDAHQREMGSRLADLISPAGPQQNLPEILALGLSAALYMQRNSSELERQHDAVNREFMVGGPSQALLTVANELHEFWEAADLYSYTGIPLVFVYDATFMAEDKLTIQSMLNHYANQTGNTAFLIGGTDFSFPDSGNLRWFKTATDMHEFLENGRFMPFTNFNKAAAVVASKPDSSVRLPPFTKYFIWPKNVWNTALPESIPDCGLEEFVTKAPGGGFAQRSMIVFPTASEIDQTITDLTSQPEKLTDEEEEDNKWYPQVARNILQKRCACNRFGRSWFDKAMVNRDRETLLGAYLSYSIACDVRAFHREGNVIQQG